MGDIGLYLNRSEINRFSEKQLKALNIPKDVYPIPKNIFALKRGYPFILLTLNALENTPICDLKRQLLPPKNLPEL